MIKSYFRNIRKELLQVLSESQQEILIAIYWFTNQELFDCLMNQLKKGVSVKLIIHNDYINNRESGLQFQQLIDLGCKFYFSDSENPMHNKFCIIDSRILINGSYNWTYFAEIKNRENILIIQEEKEVIESFIEEFKRLTKLTSSLIDIKYITKFEIDLNDELNHREYLAQDILYKAKVTKNEKLVIQAFEYCPDNIKIQKLADSLNLLNKKVLNTDIGLSIVNDEIKYLAKKGDPVPSTYTTILRTNFENQTKSDTKIIYGQNPKASDNKLLTEFIFNEIPPLPKGKAEIKFTFSIDVDGSALIELLSLNNSKKISKKISNLEIIKPLE
jgi:hypothetical protein